MKFGQSFVRMGLEIWFWSVLICRVWY